MRVILVGVHLFIVVDFQVVGTLILHPQMDFVDTLCFVVCCLLFVLCPLYPISCSLKLEAVV